LIIFTKRSVLVAAVLALVVVREWLIRRAGVGCEPVAPESESFPIALPDPWRIGLDPMLLACVRSCSSPRECGSVLAGVKAEPVGWPAASLDPGCGRRWWAAVAEQRLWTA
jgi:hypothetical protein